MSAAWLLIFLITTFIKRFESFENNIFQHFPPSKINNTEYLLSDEELSIQFTLSWLTFLNKNKWIPEWLVESNPEQLNFQSIRYELAFLSYSTVLFCAKTPAYRQICTNILSNTIERMLQRDPVWQYIDFWWGPNMAQKTCEFDVGGCLFPEKANWTAASTWPDPVAFQNIMYSGHLAHMITLFEAVTQNNTYSINGWDFIFNHNVSFHYNTSSLLTHLANVQLNKHNKQGAISCEPFQSFTVCNQHQNIAMHLYNNVLYPNNSQHDIYNKAMNKFYNYFKYETPWKYHNDIDIRNDFDGWVRGLYFQDKEMYLDSTADQPWSQQHLEAGWILDHSGFAPIGVWGFEASASLDAWAATVSYLWLNENDLYSFVCNNGYLKLYNRHAWISDKKYNGSYIDDPFGGTCFSTSLYIVGAKQCLYFNSLNKSIDINGIMERIEYSRNYLVNKYGVVLKNKYNITAPFINSSGHNCDKTQGASIINTALFGASLSVYNNSWKLIHSKPWPQKQIDFELLYVNYPYVMVRYAMVNENNVLEFELVVAVGKDQYNSIISVKLNGGFNKVTQNGEILPTNKLNINGNILIINTTIKVVESSLFYVFLI
eukprot:109191_1